MPDDAILRLTTAIASGDSEAFGRFYQDWFDFAYAQARRATRRDEATCLDIVQDAMMKVIRSIRPFEEEARFRPWLRAVINSCAYDRLRAEARRRDRELKADKQPTASHQANDLDERLTWLRSELANMDGMGLELLTMRHRFGWTLARIGAAVGLSPGAVDGRIARTMAELRRRGRQALGNEVNNE